MNKIEKSRDSQVDDLYKKAAELFAAGKRNEAEPLLRQILKINPQESVAHNMIGQVLETKGRYEEATQHFRLGCAYGEGHPERYLIMMNLAIRLREAGKPQEALALLKSVIEMRPDEARAYSIMGNVTRDMGNIDEAHRLYLKASELDPKLQNNWNFLGTINEIKQDFEAARKCFETALDLDQNNAFARSNLIDILEKLGRVDEADKVLAATPEAIRSAPSVLLSTSRLKARRGDYKGAVAMLETYDDEGSHEHRLRSHVRHYDLGKYLDKLNEYDRAFSHMQKANEIRKLTPEARNRNLDALTNEIIDHRGVLTREWVSRWTPPVPYTKGRAPAFLVGFPRSGTTLIDVMLGAHPDVKVLEERPTTAYLGAEVMKLSGGALGGIMNFTPEQIESLQDHYFSHAARYAAFEKGELLVDKMPLATRFVDIFYRVFPNAKIVRTLRHPCDVILSCYMQNFVPNRVTLPLLDLKSAAKLYAATMDLFETCRAFLPIDVHEIRYENLVADPQTEMRKTAEFLELPWNDNILKHHENGAKHIVTSASYAQVKEAIHGRASGRWVHYRQYLEPIFPIIRSAAQRYGYSLD